MTGKNDRSSSGKRGQAGIYPHAIHHSAVVFTKQVWTMALWDNPDLHACTSTRTSTMQID
jgi:hypothetical protein